jgi:hypothetical protein
MVDTAVRDSGLRLEKSEPTPGIFSRPQVDGGVLGAHLAWVIGYVPYRLGLEPRRKLRASPRLAFWTQPKSENYGARTAIAVEAKSRKKIGQGATLGEKSWA